MAEPGVVESDPDGQHDLLDRYRESLSCLLGWRRDRDDIVDEATDHLYLATEQLVRNGLEPEEAQRRVLDRFGDVRSVAASVATTSSGTVALPTRFTQYAGAIGFAVGIGWLTWGALLMFAGAALLVDPTTNRVIGPISLVGVTTLDFMVLPVTCLALAGLLRRAGASWRDPGLILAGLLGIVGPATALVAWHVFRGSLDTSAYGWVPWLLMGAIGPIAIVAVLRLRSLGARSGRYDLLLALGMPIGLLLRQLGVWLGPDQSVYVIPCPGQAVMLLSVGPILFGLGLIVRSKWLATEEIELGATSRLDLRWAVPGAFGMVVGVGGVIQAVGYLASELMGRSGFLFVALPGPAVTALSLAVAGFWLGRLALGRARGRSVTVSFG